MFKKKISNFFFDIYTRKGEAESMFIGGKEGIMRAWFEGDSWQQEWLIQGHSFGEVRVGSLGAEDYFLAGISPMHGDTLAVYLPVNFYHHIFGTIVAF